MPHAGSFSFHIHCITSFLIWDYKIWSCWARETRWIVYRLSIVLFHHPLTCVLGSGSQLFVRLYDSPLQVLSLGWQNYFIFCLIAVGTKGYTFVKPLLVTWNRSALAKNGWNEQDCLGSHCRFLLISDITILHVFQTFFSKFTCASNFLIKMCYCDPRVYQTVKLHHISSFGIAKLPHLDFPEILYWGKSQNE